MQGGFSTDCGHHIAFGTGSVLLAGDQVLLLQSLQRLGADLEAGIADEAIDLVEGQVVADTQDRQDEELLLVELLAGQQAAQGVEHLVVGAAQQVTEQILGIAALRRWRGGQAQLGSRLACGQRVLAALEHQRGMAAVVEGEHLADEDHMVAALVLERRAALEARGAAGQQRGGADAVVQLDAGELVAALGGKTPGQRFLFGGQHVHVPVLLATEGRQAAGVLGQAPQHQRRIQRHGVETVGGDADRLAVGAAGSDDGHPRGKGTQGGAKCLRVEGSRSVHALPRLSREW
ncbi:hypothetical protein D3C78_1021430 [compost metagenome]